MRQKERHGAFSLNNWVQVLVPICASMIELPKGRCWPAQRKRLILRSAEENRSAQDDNSKSFRIAAGLEPVDSCERCYARRGSSDLFAPIRFIWNATRGHRLTPWRSEFLRWRVETYSGKPAGTLSAKDVFSFVWSSRWELLSFLAWTSRLEKETRKRG